MCKKLKNYIIKHQLLINLITLFVGILIGICFHQNGPLNWLKNSSALAEWAAALGTIAAVWSPILIYKNQRKVIIKAHLNYDYVFGTFKSHANNLSQFPLEITFLGFFFCNKNGYIIVNPYDSDTDFIHSENEKEQKLTNSERLESHGSSRAFTLTAKLAQNELSPLYDYVFLRDKFKKRRTMIYSWDCFESKYHIDDMETVLFNNIKDNFDNSKDLYAFTLYRDPYDKFIISEHIHLHQGDIKILSGEI